MLRILLAEDNPVNQVVATRLLEKRGHTVVAVGNGREALDALDNDPFDLALLDLQMPEMDGLQAVGLIRQREEAEGRARLPIIALTAHAMRGDRERCLTAGMDGYITKPINKTELLATIDSVLQIALPGDQQLCRPLPMQSLTVNPLDPSIKQQKGKDDVSPERSGSHDPNYQGNCCVVDLGRDGDDFA